MVECRTGRSIRRFAVVSVEMVEDVGCEYLDIYFRSIEKQPAPGGRAALQAITMPDHRIRATRDTYTWIQKYIFPGGFLPATRLITDTVARGTGLRVTERFSIGEYYAHTLRLWQERFDGYTDRVSALGLDPVYSGCGGSIRPTPRLGSAAATWMPSRSCRPDETRCDL